MSHTSHPYSMRLGIIRPWKSRWFRARGFSEFLKEDIMLREFLTKKLKGMFVDAVDIERSPANTVIIIKTARPGLVIGRGGEGVERLKNEIVLYLSKLRGKSNIAIVADQKKKSAPVLIKLNIEEIKSPEAHAKIMVDQIAQDLEKRLPFRRVMKQTVAKIMASREVKGVKVVLAGRLDGAEMARYEWLKEGRVPLQTLRADIDFARGRAHLPYGDLGIKVWIYKGELFSKEENVISKKSKI